MPFLDTSKRKFQLCNGYLLEFDQLARVMNVIAEKPEALKVTQGRFAKQPA